MAPQSIQRWNEQKEIANMLREDKNEERIKHNDEVRKQKAKAKARARDRQNNIRKRYEQKAVEDEGQTAEEIER